MARGEAGETFELAPHNPFTLSAGQLRGRFVGRAALLERLVEGLRASEVGQPVQHQLLIGAWGSGKSAFLHRLGLALENRLGGRYLPLRPALEPRGLGRLAELWEGALAALEEHLEARGRAAQAGEIRRALERLGASDEGEREELALEHLLGWARAQQRVLVLLLDEAEIILANLGSRCWALRETLSSAAELAVVGAARAAPSAVLRYDGAFHEFFDLHRLEDLSAGESGELLARLARQHGRADLERYAERHPARLAALRTFLGGRPRLLVLLYQILLEDPARGAADLLARLLDHLTPVHEATFAALPDQARVVLGGLARAWHPITSRALAAALRMEPNKVAAYLARLARRGHVLKVPYPPGRKTGYLLADRLLNAWYLLRCGAAERGELADLVRFLELYHEPAARRPRGEHRAVLDALEDWPGGSAEGVVRARELGERLAARGSAVAALPLRAALAAIACGEPARLARLAPEAQACAREIHRRMVSEQD